MSDLDRYVLRDAIGSGMFATVYSGHDERFDAPVAIKVLAENHSLNPEVRERFIVEARALRRLRSTHIVRVHDLGENERGQPFMVLDQCGGGTLADRVAAKRPSTPPSRADVEMLVEALVEGLGEMHTHHLVHRDLSPRNLLLRGNGGGISRSESVLDGDTIVISDLGFVKDLDAASGLTASGGTDGYAAPEQQRPGSIVDQRADIYAASAVLQWFVHDRLPDLVPVVERGMSIDPDDRQPDMATWGHDMRAALTPQRHGSPATELAMAPSQRSPRRYWLIALVGALTFCAAGVVAGASLTNGDANQPEQRVLPNGDAELRREVGGIALTVTGPLEFDLDTPVTFIAATADDAEIFWISPDGRIVNDRSSLTLSATSRGAGSFTAVAVSGPDRAIIEVNFLVE